MNTPPTIVCPVDYSEPSRRALQYAAFLTGHFGARLVMLHVLDRSLVDRARREAPEFTDDLIAFYRESLPLPEKGMPGVSFLSAIGEASKEILHAARQQHADLIVMGTHGMTGGPKLIFGSTTERVLREANVPVLAVPTRGHAVIPDDDPRFTLSPILVPIDFSDTAARAACIGAGIARAVGATLVLVHAVRPVHAIGRWRQEAQEHEASLYAAARAQLCDLVRVLDLSGPPEVVIRTGSAAEVIADAASHHRARLIVMGVHGDGRDAAAPGSVTYRVLCQATAPVLALPAAAIAGLPVRHAVEPVDAEC